MKSFRQYLDEVFNKTYPYTLKVTDERWSDEADDVVPVRYEGKFKTKDGGRVDVIIVNHAEVFMDPKLGWQVDFTKNGELDASGEGDEFVIISTVLRIINDFVKKENPKIVMFDAGKSGRGLRNKDTRSNLYKRLVKKFSGQIGYTYKFKDESDMTTFILTKR
jgi:hypothetical protein